MTRAHTHTHRGGRTAARAGGAGGEGVGGGERVPLGVVRCWVQGPRHQVRQKAEKPGLWVCMWGGGGAGGWGLLHTNCVRSNSTCFLDEGASRAGEGAGARGGPVPIDRTGTLRQRP